MNSPTGEDLAFIFQEEGDEQQLTDPPAEDDGNITDDGELTTSSVTSENDLFTIIRMELAQSRSSRLEQLETVVASGTASSEEKNKAYDEIKAMDALSSKELIVEETLKSEYGYPDVLVRTMDESIVVTIKADELSETEANHIMRMVYDEFGPLQVEVKFQPASS